MYSIGLSSSSKENHSSTSPISNNVNSLLLEPTGNNPKAFLNSSSVFTFLISSPESFENIL